MLSRADRSCARRRELRLPCPTECTSLTVPLADRVACGALSSPTVLSCRASKALLVSPLMERIAGIPVLKDQKVK
jgi:hypothetical protein